MSHIYRVPMNGNPKGMLVQATTAPRAKSSARDHVFGTGEAVRLTAGQIAAAIKAGEDLLVVDADPIDEERQPDLPGIDANGVNGSPDGGEGND